MPKGVYQRKPRMSKEERAAQQSAYYHNIYKKRPGTKERAAELNARPEQKEKRKAYKKTVAGRTAEKRYRRNSYAARGYHHEYRLITIYGITEAEYQIILSGQGGVCAICSKSVDGRLHVDHDHETKVVRGLLCGTCNRGLGMYQDKPELLRKAADYLDAISSDDSDQEVA